jgi:hypothetical protein
VKYQGKISLNNYNKHLKNGQKGNTGPALGRILVGRGRRNGRDERG